jgi:hypothetical protein
MNKLLDLLRSERPLLGGAFGRIAEELSFDRAVVRIAGFLILWAVPNFSGPPFILLGYSASLATSPS